MIPRPEVHPHAPAIRVAIGPHSAQRRAVLATTKPGDLFRHVDLP